MLEQKSRMPVNALDVLIVGVALTNGAGVIDFRKRGNGAKAKPAYSFTLNSAAARLCALPHSEP